MFSNPCYIKLSFTSCLANARGLTLFVAFGFIPLIAQPRFSQAQNWPQILGPTRNGVVEKVDFSAESLKGRLVPAWSVDIGSGFAGVAVADAKVLAFHRKGDKELLTAMRLSTGKKLWEQSWPASYRASINPDNGPRSVPAVSEGKVVCYGAAGDMHCVRVADGKKLWSRSLREEYSARDGYFGAGSSPLIVEDKAVICIGGKKAGIVAVDLNSGETKWTATDYDASYASPVVVPDPAGTKLLVVTRLVTTLLDAATGELLSEIKFGSRGPTVNAATPIEVAEKTYLLTASYGIGATLLRVVGSELEVEYDGEPILSSQYNTPVFVGGRIVGIDGREDLGGANLRAFEPATRTLHWQSPDFGTAHLIAGKTNVLALTLDGRLSQIDPSQGSLVERGVAQLPSGTYRALPALVGNQLITRFSTGTSTSKVALFRLQ